MSKDLPAIDCEELLLQVLVAMAMSDSSLDKSELHGICDIYEDLTGRELAKADARAHAEAFCHEKDDTIDVLGAQAPSLTNDEKEKIICGAYRVLIADGFIAAEEKNTLRKIADAMKMPEIHYQAVLEKLVSD